MADKLKNSTVQEIVKSKHNTENETFVVQLLFVEMSICYGKCFIFYVRPKNEISCSFWKRCSKLKILEQL